MRKIILYIATSVDGYIAASDGDINWLHDPKYTLEKEGFGYQQMYDSIDTTIMGNTTYQEILGFDVPFPYPDKTNYVFSHQKHENTRFVNFISEDISSFIRNVKSQKGKDIWLVGGSQVNSVLLNHDLIDEIIITQIPIILGDGIPLFHGVDKSTQINLKGVTSYENGFVQMTFSNIE